ncbi:serine--tRNA ligase, partial [Gammaproteobacteria bacterium]|nr:serine--tRNA ligase [Gammaproteobacteria bacterium]
MIDTNLIKLDPKQVFESLKSKKYELNLEAFDAFELDRKNFQTQTEDLQAQRNTLSKEYGLLRKEGKEDKTLNDQIESIKIELDACSQKLTDTQGSFRDFLLDIPNLPSDST